jgi:CHAP domain
MSASADKVVAIALKEVGYKEKPVNITKYGAWYGMDGQSWCAMFVSWCFNQAGLTSLIAAGPKGYAGCQTFEAWAKAHNLIVPTATVQAGDILLFDFYKSGVAEHTGIATGGFDPHTHLVPTVEGNTAADNAGPQANGDGTYIKHRALSTIRAVVRPKYPN